MHLFAILPIELSAEEKFVPEEYSKFKIFPEREISFPNFMPIGIVIETVFSHEQLVSIFVKCFEKEKKEESDDTHETTHVR